MIYKTQNTVFDKKIRNVKIFSMDCVTFAESEFSMDEAA